jgi:hypothetical protein
MKKAKKLASNELRSEYKRSDFGALVRGKYIEQLKATSNVVVLDPEVAELFPKPLPSTPVPSVSTTLRRCQAAAESLDALPSLEPQQKLKLAAVLGRMREKAHTLDVPLIGW